MLIVEFFDLSNKTRPTKSWVSLQVAAQVLCDRYHAYDVSLLTDKSAVIGFLGLDPVIGHKNGFMRSEEMVGEIEAFKS